MTDALDHPVGSTPPGPRAETELVQASLVEALGPDFELLRPLGSGPTSHIFLAREVALRRLVAVKVLRREVGENETVRARFEREAHAAAGIRHPNIPTIHRIGRTSSGLPFMIQEYVEGRTLGDRLKAMGPIGAQETRRIVADLAGALSANPRHATARRDATGGSGTAISVVVNWFQELERRLEG